MCVAKDGWSRGPDEINVLVSVHVPDMRAFGLVHEKRLAADGAKGAHRRIDTAGNVIQSRGEELVGFGPAPHARKLAGAAKNCQRQEDRRRKQRRQVAERQAPISVDAEGDEFDRVEIIGTARLTVTLYGR